MNTEMQKTTPEEALPRFRPAVDVFESPSAFNVILDMPGVSKDHVSVNIENDTLHVSAKRTHGSNEAYFYDRLFTLPGSIERDKIDANMKAGVLTLTLPKHESKQPKKIQVKAA